MNDFIESWTVGDLSRPVHYQVTATKDVDTKPEDSDCYSQEDIRRWREDEWEYVVLSVVPVFRGATVETAIQHLGGVEWGELKPGEWIDKDSDHIGSTVGELVEQARAELEKWLAEILAASTPADRPPATGGRLPNGAKVIHYMPDLGIAGAGVVIAEYRDQYVVWNQVALYESGWACDGGHYFGEDAVQAFGYYAEWIRQRALMED